VKIPFTGACQRGAGGGRATAFFARSAERGDPREAAHLALSRAALALADSWSYAVDASAETVPSEQQVMAAITGLDGYVRAH